MKRNVIIYALAGAALTAAGPALAKPGGGNGGGHGNAGATVGATATGGGSLSGAGTTVGSDINTTVGSSISTRGASGTMGRGAAMGSGHVGGTSAIDMRGSTSMKSATTRSGASTQLGGTTRLSSQLTGVTSGMTVVDTGGATIGTVSGITTRGNGGLRTVQVTLTDGSIITLAPSSLSLNGGVLTTNSLTTNVRSQGAAHANINGLIHASPNSALARAGVTTLTGLTTGLTVNNTGGTTLGTVNQVFLNQSGAVVGIQVSLDSGGTAFIPATSLSMNGTTVVTSFVPHG
jgi:hypothetical protein